MSLDKKIRVYSVVSDPFRYGFFVMARTVLEKNPNLDIEFVVLHHDELSPLAAEHREWLGSRVPGVTFRHVDLSPYTNIFRLRDEFFETPRRLWAAFLILEAFADDSEDAHVLCLDSDMICVGEFGEDLFRHPGFAAVEARLGDGSRLGYFNTGVMAVGRTARGPAPYRRLMATTDGSSHESGRGRADQALLALWYTPSNAACLPWRYNVTKRHVPERRVREAMVEKNAVFFHYVGAKPWHVSLDKRDLRDHEVVGFWDEVIADQLSMEERVAYLEFWRDSSRAIAQAYIAQKVARAKARKQKWRSVARYAARRARSILVRSGRA